ncbi:MAG: LysR family transcriptional regulator [Clostridia bacterium]|nr:LysR family transcriptional regulator [Clostridia bacterium]
MIETYLLEQFAAFAKCGTLLKASEELHISQPTLSRSMKKLEDALGVSIFHRENSKLTLNETGIIAAEYARKALDANQDMIDHVIAFDRGLHTISVGACSPFPINALMPTLQEYLSGKTISTELRDDAHLIAGLKNHGYHLAILHACPADSALYCQRYLDEQLYISVMADHPLAGEEDVTFSDLQGLRILMPESVGFWMHICEKHFSPSNLLVQSNADALGELIDASSLPFFNSDRMIELGYTPPGRVFVPICDADASATYWLCCLKSVQKQYRSLFNAVRGAAITARSARSK